FNFADRVDIAPERQLCAFPCSVAYRGLPLVPLCLWEKLQYRLNLSGKRRRRNRPRQNPHSHAIHGFLRSRQALRFFLESRPSANVTGKSRWFLPVRIV